MFGEFLGLNIVHCIEAKIDKGLEGPASYSEDEAGKEGEGWSDDWLGHDGLMVEVTKERKKSLVRDIRVKRYHSQIICRSIECSVHPVSGNHWLKQVFSGDESCRGGRAGKSS